MDKFEARIKEERLTQATKAGLMGSSGKIGTIVKYLGEPIISQTEGRSLHEVGENLLFYSSTLYDDDELENYTVTGSWGESFEIQTQNVEDGYGNPVESPTGYSWNEKPYKKSDFSIEQIGWQFDAMRYGYHLNIHYLEVEKELLVQYESKRVYQEIGADLMMYIPGNWEDIIYRIYPKAAEIKKQKETEQISEAKQEAVKNKQNWFNEMWKKWGFNEKN